MELTELIKNNKQVTFYFLVNIYKEEGVLSQTVDNANLLIDILVKKKESIIFALYSTIIINKTELVIAKIKADHKIIEFDAKTLTLKELQELIKYCKNNKIETQFREEIQCINKEGGILIE